MTTPLFTGWNYAFGEPYLTYIDRKIRTGDITRMQRDSAREITKAISNQTKEILLGQDALAQRTVEIQPPQRDNSAIEGLTQLAERSAEARRQDTEMLISAFGQGINELSSRLDNLSEGVDELNYTFQWCFGEVLASLGGIQDSIKDLTRAVKMRATNDAYEKFDWARDAFKRELYPDALEYLSQAIAIYKLEWRFYLLKGIIRLGSPNLDKSLINLPEAESMFLLTARYAKSVDKHEAAKAMLQAGWAAYVQQRLEQARQHTDEAIVLNGNLGEARYQAAKIAMVDKNPTKGIQMLSKAIDLDIGYIAKADTDHDFAPYRPEMLKLFEEKRQLVLKRVLSLSLKPFGLEEIGVLELFNWGLLELLEYERAAKEAIEEITRIRNG